MSQKLWEAKQSDKKKSNLYKFEKFISNKFKYRFSNNYNNLLNWSIKNPKLFWSSVWDFTNVIGNKTEKFNFTKEFILLKYIQRIGGEFKLILFN